ncbi:MAG TPA: Gfo/Idh/MocA family oxidoreductase, partial [Thermoanaerobaculia bacterium]|nr:Gfo/Idh/MocA family oxidoreductase [Thermoanaerobaculia bacterium]
MTEPHVLIVGAGSAGKRHARNVRTLGARVSLVDSRPDRLDEARTEGDTVSVFGDLETALANSRFDGFVIATPPSLHVSQILRITREERPWILCEKPLGLTASEAQALQHLNDRILLGYTYRWWPPIQRFRERLLNGDIGRIRGLRFVMSAHLADWHPWESYQGFFMADRTLGGGALLDESHFIDLMLWMCPSPQKVYAQVEKVSDLDINADDNVEAIISYSDGLRVNMHLDLIGRPHRRTITALGEGGSL